MRATFFKVPLLFYDLKLLLVALRSCVLKNVLYSFWLVLIFICVPHNVKSNENKTKIDSLINQLNTTTETTNKVDILNSLFENTKSTNPEKALKYATQALDLAKKINYLKGKSAAYNNMSAYYSSINDIEKAIEFKKSELLLHQESNDKSNTIACIISIGDLYKRLSRYDNAMAYYFDGLGIAEDWLTKLTSESDIAQAKKTQAKLIYLIGRVYEFQNKYPDALKYLSRALDIYQLVKDEKGIADTYLALAIVYYDRCNTGTSQTFIYPGEHKEAFDYAIKAKKIYEKLKDNSGIVKTGNYLGYISAGQGQFGAGVEYAKAALKVAQENKIKGMEISIYGTIGDIYHAQGNYKKALEYIDKCYEGSKAIQNQTYIRDIYLSYANIYAKLNEHKKAYDYLKLYHQLKDKLLNEASTKQIAEINAKYDSEKKDKELIQKNAELIQKQAAFKQQNIQKNALIAAFGFMLIVVFFIYRGYRNNKKANESILKQKEEIEKSYESISILSEIEKEIAASLTIEKIIEKTYENVNKLMNADIFCIGYYNQEQNTIDFPGFIEKGKKYNSSYDLNDDTRFPVICFKNNEEIFINDLDKEFSNYLAYIPPPVAGETPNSLIYLPLTYNNKTIGVITVESFTKNAYNQYHLQILRNLAVFVAIALENAQLYKNLEIKILERTTEVIKQKEEIEKSYINTKLLSNIGREITQLLSVDEIIQKVYENVNKVMDASVFGIGIHKPEEDALEFTFIEKGERLPNFYIYLKDIKRPGVWCFKKQEEIIIYDYEKEYVRFLDANEVPEPIKGDRADSVIYLPLTKANNLIGVITVQCFKKNEYSEYHLDILRSLAIYVVSALENARLYQSMEEEVKSRTQEVIKQKEELEISYNNIHVLSDIGQQLTSTLDFEAIFNKLHDSISTLMDAECFGVRLYHPQTQTIEVKYEYDKGVRIQPISFSMDNDNNYSVWCIKNRKEIFINDNTVEHKNYVKDIVVINGDMTHSLMFCPMILQDTVIGVVTVQSYSKNKYTPRHLDILRTLANYTAIALENAQLYESLEEKVRQRTLEVISQKEEVEKSHENTKLLSDIGREITSVLTVEEIIKKAYENVNRLMDASAFGIGIYNEEDNQIEFSGFIEKGERLPFYFVSLNEDSRPAIWCFSQQQELIINDFQKQYNNYFPNKEIPAPKEGDQPESMIYLPLSTTNKKVGVITVQSFNKNAYSQYQLNILRNLALYVVNGLENARLYENMEEKVKARTLQIEKQKDELARLSLVASETDNGVLIFNAKGEIEWVNAGFTRLQGYTLEELKQRSNTIEKISNNPEIQTLVQESIKHKKSSVYQSLNITKYGKELWIQSSLTPIVDETGSLKNWVVIDVDITNLKKAEDSIRQQNEKITDSINYAQKIQETLLPPLDEIKKYLPTSFILYKPKDIVSGDFYWVYKHDRKIFIAVADCTGHGVPGAFMSLMGNNLLNDIVKVKGKEKPSEILDELNIQILTTLNQNSKTTSVKYGMDIALISIEAKSTTDNQNVYELQYAGAHSPLLLFRNNESIQVKANKRAIGSFVKDEESDFINHSLTLTQGDMIYMFSDGYADQIGGPEKKKMFAQPFRDLLQSVSQKNVDEQQMDLEKTLNQWKGPNHQTDDILVMGIQIASLNL
ncbi:MAG: GAF domain-containing protein [Bacteroidia bacterium]